MVIKQRSIPPSNTIDVFRFTLLGINVFEFLKIYPVPLCCSCPSVHLHCFYIHSFFPSSFIPPSLNGIRIQPLAAILLTERCLYYSRFFFPNGYSAEYITAFRSDVKIWSHFVTTRTKLTEDSDLYFYVRIRKWQ